MFQGHFEEEQGIFSSNGPSGLSRGPQRGDSGPSGPEEFGKDVPENIDGPSVDLE